jgi:selenocysteine lyase/cysteine desulfurase
VGWRSVPDLCSPDRFKRYELYDDARRFEVGFPSFPTIYLLQSSLAWLQQFDADAVRDHVLGLSGRLVRELTDRGWTLLTALDDDHQAGNVAVVSEYGAELARALPQDGVHCWGGDGRLRGSVNLFNGDDDIDDLLTALDGVPEELLPHLANPAVEARSGR